MPLTIKPPKNPLVLAPETNPFETANVYQTYPEFPWISIDGVYDGSAYLIGPMSDNALLGWAKLGRENLAPCLEHNIEDMDAFCNFIYQCNKSTWQHNPKDRENAEWSEMAVSDLVNNWGAYADAEGVRVNAKGNMIRTGYDGIFQVLEALEVEMGLDYEMRRTINPIVYPNGPNIFVRSVQDRAFKRTIDGREVEFKPTNAVIQNIYNIFDGVIIMDKSPNQASLSKGPGKRRYDWASVTWYQWRSLHKLPKQSIFDALTAYQAFPNAMPSGSKNFTEMKREQDGFQNHSVSGRPPSELRAPLELYQRLSCDDTHARTLQRLNYIICCGDCITDHVVSIIQRCLRARDDEKAKHGRGPVWGWHETFQIGHWAFYLLLSTELGQNITWFLAKRKDPAMFGHLMLESVTIFVTDSVRSVKDGGGCREIVKWPVLVWKVVPFHEDLITRLNFNEEFYISKSGNHMMDPDDDKKPMLPSIPYQPLPFKGPPARLANRSVEWGY